jgi:hypothetical protein
LPGSEPPADKEIAFNLVFVPDGAPGDVSGSVHTRVSTATDFVSTWDNGDETGLFAVSHTTGTNPPLAASGNYIDNASLTRSGALWTYSPLYFPAGGNELDFYAYYPRQATVTDATNMSVTVRTDQSTAANYNLSDLLWSKAVNQTSGNTLTLVFTQAMSLV